VLPVLPVEVTITSYSSAFQRTLPESLSFPQRPQATGALVGRAAEDDAVGYDEHIVGVPRLAPRCPMPRRFLHSFLLLM
jgi:hypothetical protein